MKILGKIIVMLSIDTDSVSLADAVTSGVATNIRNTFERSLPALDTDRIKTRINDVRVVRT